MERNGPARPDALAPLVERLHSMQFIQRPQRAGNGICQTKENDASRKIRTSNSAAEQTGDSPHERGFARRLHGSN